jgi:hypothetical protein
MGKPALVSAGDDLDANPERRPRSAVPPERFVTTISV